jgi:acylphosphatase
VLIIIIIGTTRQKNNMMKRVHLYVSGLVQGVYFRHHTERTARSLGLTGWVRNLGDGRVEVLCEGPEERLGEMIDWCREGPRSARVERVESLWEGHTGEFGSFEIQY